MKGDGSRRPQHAAEPIKRDSRGADLELAGLHEIALHGHRVFYRAAGSGPVVVLVHGITSTSATWANVLPYLAERFTVIAPDLLGHGDSAKPRGDYSLGAYASGIRDLLIALGHERATFVGHSLGGGVAMPSAITCTRSAGTPWATSSAFENADTVTTASARAAIPASSPAQRGNRWWWWSTTCAWWPGATG